MMNPLKSALPIMTFVAMSLSLCACDSKKAPPTHSNDAAKLVATLNLTIPVQSATWEKFDYPEDDGTFIPATYEMTVLVAEIAPQNPLWFAGSEAGEAPRPPDAAARSWMSEDSKTLIRDGAQKHPDRCKEYSTFLKTGRHVKGFTCHSGKKVLLFLVMASEGQ